MSRRWISCASALFGIMFLAVRPSLAEPDRDTAARSRETPQVTRDGMFLPYTESARIGDQRVAAFTLGGYDTGAGQGPLFSVIIEGALFNHVALRAGIQYLSLEGGQVGPLVGLRFGLLRQERHKIDLGLAVNYLNRGLSQPRGEPDGEMQMIVSFGRRFDRFGLFGNLVYNQGLDPEERNIELRVAGLYSLTDSLNIGFDLKGHYELTEAEEQVAENIVSNWDVVAGPLVSYSWSHLMLMAQVGAHVEQLRANSNIAAGVVAMGGVGSSF